MTFLPEYLQEALRALQAETPDSPQEDTASALEQKPAEETKHYGWNLALNACC